MIWLLLGAHIVAAGFAAAVGARLTPQLLLRLAALPSLATTVWAVALLSGSSDDTETASVDWVEGLELGLTFRLDSVALLMTLLVSGIGVLVFVYASGYFGKQARGVGRFTAALIAFSGSMLGLVWADSIWTLFIFWELTSVTSFLLVGHKNTDEAALAAARRALMITGAGGLVLLAGLLVIADVAGTSTISELTAITGTKASVAAALVMVGAATKSAQFPFHVWLPGAMAAPTPVSAYLHSATMVKAGVLLVAVLVPALGGVTAFKVIGMTFGIASILWGAIGALRQRDAKLILAWGTVSQLGLMITLLAIGESKAIFAAVAIVVAHAIFKAALFLIVGEIDVRTGTRDIDELGGLSRSMPFATAVAVVSGISMAGAPPALGFAAKEAAVEAVLKLDGFEFFAAAIGIFGGSVLTVAYTTRFLITVFGPGPETVVAPRRTAMTAPAIVLAAFTILGFVFMTVPNDLIIPAATELNAGAGEFKLLRWPGITTAFLISMGILLGGGVLGFATTKRNPLTPKPVGARSADELLEGTLRFAKSLTAIIQHGSLPVYVVIMIGTASIAAMPFLRDLSTDHLVLADNVVQAVLAAVVVIAAIAGAFVNSRLGAALTLGIVGTAMSGFFIIHGAPDLALTQLLVETIVVVGFVVGLGHLARSFPPVTGGWRGVRFAVSIFAGTLVALGLAAASANPTGAPPLDALTEGAVNEGGGNNIVNVILTDIRALDTLGEVVVLATVAIGILALGDLRSSTEEEAT